VISVSKKVDAVKELKWFVVIIICLGLAWFFSGGLQSATKQNALIKPAQPLSTGEFYGKNIFSFLSPQVRVAPQTKLPAQTSLPVLPNAQITNRGSTKTYYGAADRPILSTSQDTLKISKVNRSTQKDGSVGFEYMIVSAPTSNSKPMLLTGMLLKSRMTGNQQDIREGIPVYYLNSINQKEAIWLYPGEKAYIISGHSPFGYSFKTNKCMGYLSNSTQKFVIGLPLNCPHVLDYPLPAWPNHFSDNCLAFLNRVGTCQSRISYPSNIEVACKNFVAERTNYNRCVQDFGNDPNFLGKEWRIYLGRDTALWKSKREIVDLLDQNGRLITSFTY